MTIYWHIDRYNVTSSCCDIELTAIVMQSVSPSVIFPTVMGTEIRLKITRNSHNVKSENIRYNIPSSIIDVSIAVAGITQTLRQTETQTDTQTDRHSDRQILRQADTQTGRMSRNQCFIRLLQQRNVQQRCALSALSQIRRIC